MSYREIFTKILNEIFSRKFAKFFIAGFIAFLVDTAILIFIKEGNLLGENDQKILNLIYTSKVISSAVGVTVSFLLNRYWSFRATHKTIKNQAWKMSIVYVLNIFVSAVIYTIYFEIILFQHFLDLSDFAIVLANVLTVGTMMFSNFFIYRLIVFK